MTSDVRVLIVEDDIYARDMMSMLITRDWRTRVVGEAGDESEMREVLEGRNQRVDLILLDTEFPGDPEWPFRLAKIAQEHHDPPLIICTGTQPSPRTLSYILQRRFSGYILKSEIQYALAWAIIRAKEGKWVTTPSVRKLARSENIRLPGSAWIMDGTHPVTDFSETERTIARLGILFNMRRKNVADETMLAYSTIRGAITQVYKKLELDDLISGEMDPGMFFEGQSKVLARFQNAQEKGAKGEKKKRSANEAATLAFHLLTVPHEHGLSHA